MAEQRTVKMVIETRSYHLVELEYEDDDLPDLDNFPDWYELIGPNTHIDSEGPIWHIPDQSAVQGPVHTRSKV